MVAPEQLWEQLCWQLSTALQIPASAQDCSGASGHDVAVKRQVVLALSGGLDSMLLLALLAELRAELPLQLQAVHVCHQLHQAAGDWVEFCRQQCVNRAVPFTAVTVTLAEPQRNIEQQARILRYQALRQQLAPNGILLTAHHADDQLETLLLALKRGSGLTGLAGIAACQPFAPGILLRPLLPFSRQQLEIVADWLGLAYVDDPSNQDVSFDRNFLRQQIIPLLSARFPAISQTASRSAGLLQQSLVFQQQQLAVRLTDICRQDGSLALDLLAAVGQPEQDLLLHYYLQRAGLQPSMQQFQQIRQMFLSSRSDAQPQFELAGKRLRRYDNGLYLADDVPEPAAVADTPIPFGHMCQWPGLKLHLCWSDKPLDGWQALPLAIAVDTGLMLSFGQLNRRFKPAGQSVSRALKDWCKLWKVPPWQRGILPFIIAGQQKSTIYAVLRPEQPLSHCQLAQAASWLNVRWSAPGAVSGTHNTSHDCT